MRPPSEDDAPAAECPPPRIAISNPVFLANASYYQNFLDSDGMAAATSDVEVTNTTTPASLSALEAQRLIDSSQPASPGVTTIPLICETSSETSIVMMKFVDQEGEG